jgi:acetyl-CoA C-acetyltransferase
MAGDVLVGGDHPVAIVGIGQTHHSRRRTDVSQAGLVREAVDRALADAKLTIDDIDSIVVASGPVLFAAVNQPEKWVADAIGAPLKPVVRITSGGGTGLAGALAGYYQIAGGFADRVLVVAYDKLSEGALQYSISTLYDPFWGREFAVGIMGFSAAYWRARMDVLGHTEEAAARVAVKNRRNAMRNPYAHVKKEVTVDEVMNSRPLAWPIKLLDVPPISDGAAAVVLSSEKLAAKSTDRPAWIHGMGYFCEADNAPSRSMLVSEPLALAARRIYRAAGITNPRRQFDVAEVQEPYTCFELSYYETLGLCAPGEAAELIASGATDMDGDIPVNPSGGCMGANPIGAAGLIRLIEAASQVMGKAGEMQIKGAKLALVQSGGGWANLRGVAVLGA